MSHEIEADFTNTWSNEATQCSRCTSFENGFCLEAKSVVPPTAHCDFFQARD